MLLQLHAICSCGTTACGTTATGSPRWWSVDPSRWYQEESPVSLFNLLHAVVIDLDMHAHADSDMQMSGGARTWICGSTRARHWGPRGCYTSTSCTISGCACFSIQ
eukprot:jgi/Ulvmu1/7626/UM038_0052.1